MSVTFIRTDYKNQDFQSLVAELDKELWFRYQEKEAQYIKFNKTIGIDNVIILQTDNISIGCGCFKQFDDDSVEIKRMYVMESYRNKGFGGMIIGELEWWARSLGYNYTVLETAIRQPEAIHLYKKLGYEEIEKYGPYVDMDESICMRKSIAQLQPSEFKDLEGIRYFKFEENFVEKNIRCIPMIVRFKMDLAGIKLKLAEWSRFNKEERIRLATLVCDTEAEVKVYKEYLIWLVRKYTAIYPALIDVNPKPDWAELNKIPDRLKEKAAEFNLSIEIEQWENLCPIQRFTLVKLCRPGHENKNFPKAMFEFGFTESN